MYVVVLSLLLWRPVSRFRVMNSKRHKHLCDISYRATPNNDVFILARKNSFVTHAITQCGMIVYSLHFCEQTFINHE